MLLRFSQLRLPCQQIRQFRFSTVASDAQISSESVAATSQDDASKLVPSSSTEERPKRGPNLLRHDRSKKYGPLNIHEAVDLAMKLKWAKFVESVDLAINTGLDPRKAPQNVKGIARLPYGTGKASRVCVVAAPGDVKIALEAGADIAGGEEIIAAIQNGDTNFTTVIATPEMMPQLSKIGKVSFIVLLFSFLSFLN
jgi:hypothetical protein